ncbi:MAG TPA: hypothetical protein VGS02_11200 [Acidobacteriaceae bacterium]|nr:hypothetical protein [Acidobacteriaceae bacterium]
MQNRSCEKRARTLARLVTIVLAALVSANGRAQMSTTTVQGTVYRADGTPASGTLLISWPAFTTAQNQAVAAGTLNAAIGANGFVSVNLTPNSGALPAGSYYTATYHLNDGTVNQEYWIVPASGTATVGAVRAQLQPAMVAVQGNVTPSYVQSAIASLSGSYLPLTGGTMTGALSLTGDPVAATQAATKHYADQLAAQNLPLSGGALSGPLTAPSISTRQMEGRFYADQWQSGGGNNGISLSLSQCLSLPYACQVVAPATYAQAEAQPFGGTGSDYYPPLSTGPKSTDPMGQFLDQRHGVPEWIFNGSAVYDSRHSVAPTFQMNFTGNAGLTGTFRNMAGALNLATVAWSGTRSFYNDKDQIGVLTELFTKYGESQPNVINQYTYCIGFGDCLNQASIAYGRGGHTQADEGTQIADWVAEQVTQIPTATVTSASTSNGVTTLNTNTQTNINFLGAGLPVLITTPAKMFSSSSISGCYVQSITQATSQSGGPILTMSSACSIDSTFGVSQKTTLTAAIANPVSGTNSFPQTSVVTAVGSTAPFTVGKNACIWDYDSDCTPVTAIGSGTITLARVDHPHPAGAWVTAGGLAQGYSIELEYDRCNSLVSLGIAGGCGSQTIRQAFPIITNLAGNQIALFEGYDALPQVGLAYTGRAYTQMAGSGATCTTTISGGAVTGITITGGGTNYIAAADAYGHPGFPPQIVLTGSWTTAPSAYVSGITGGAVTAATVSSGGTGVTSASCSVQTLNPFDIYPMARAIDVYNHATGAVDGNNVTTQNFPVTIAASDTIEQPDSAQMHSQVGNWQTGQLIPTGPAESRSGLNVAVQGPMQGQDSTLLIQNTASPLLYAGDPYANPAIPGQGQLLAPWYMAVFQGAYRQYNYYYQPPVAPAATATLPGGYNPALIWADCGPNNDCTKWTTAYWLAGGNAASGGAGLQLTPATGTVAEVAPGAGNTSCSTTLAGSASGGFAVTCSGHTSKFDATGNLAVAGALNAQGVAAATINGEVTVDGTTYATLNAAWNAAVAKAGSTVQDQTVRLGPGLYPVTATLTEPTNGVCVSLVGSAGTTMNADSAQVATTLTVPNALGGDLIFLGNSAQAQGCTLKDLNIMAGGNATHGFELQWFRGLLVDNVTINDTSADGIVLGEENTSAGHQSSFLLRNVTVSYSSAAFAPANRPAYGIHLEKTAMDSHLDDVVVRNALLAAVYNEGTGNTGYLVHGFGYPYTCTTTPCANTASSGSAGNASYATDYVIYDMGGGGSVWTDTYMDSPAMAGFYIGANGVEIHGGHIQWPELTSFPGANLAYVAANVGNNLLIADVDCISMSPTANWITYGAAAGTPPTFASVHHLTGCGNYYQALEPATTTGFSSGGANINDSSGAVPRVWSTPVASAASYPAYSAQLYTGYQGDAFQAHFSGAAPFFNVTYQGTIRTNGGIALSTVTNTASTLTLTAANKNVIANASSGPQTITLPSCYAQLPDRAAPTGLEFTIIKSDTSGNAVTVATTSSQLIYSQGVSAGTLVLSGPSTQTLVCGPDNNWYVAGSTAASASTPHMTWYGTFAGTFGTSANNSLGAIWTPGAGVTMTRLDIAVGTAPAGCTTWPVIGIYDSTAATWLKTVTLASGTYGYRNAVSGVNITAGHNLSMGVQTAGAGCSTNAGTAQLTMEYVMQ